MKQPGDKLSQLPSARTGAGPVLPEPPAGSRPPTADNEDRLALALAASATSIWDYDMVTGWVSFDAGWARMLGHEPAPTATTIRQVFGLVHPEERPGAFASVQACLTGRQDSYDREYRVKGRNGDWVWVHSRGRVTARDATGRALRLLGTNTDITARKQAELALARDAEFLSALNQTTLAVLERRSKQETLEALAEQATGLLQLDRVEIALLEDGELVTLAGGRPPPATGDRRGRTESPLFWQVVDQRQPVLTGGPAAGRPAVAAFPILLNQRVLGVLGLFRPATGPAFTADEQKKGRHLAQFTALVVHNASIYEDAVRLADKRAADLQEREEQYRQVVENINQGFYTASPRSVFTYCNPSIGLVTGQKPEDLLGTSSFRLVAAADRARVIALYRAWAADSVKNAVAEFRVEKPGGEFIWVEQLTQIVRGSDGRVVEFRNFLRDITERKAATDALRESEERFRGVFDKSPVSIALLTLPEGRITEINATAEAAFGYTLAEARGRSSTELNLWVDPADRERYLAALQAHGHVPAFEARLRRKDGSIFTALYSGSLVTIAGRQYSLNSIQDISQRKQAEEALRASESENRRLALITSETTDAIAMCGPDRHIQWVNQGFTRLTGYTAEEAVGQSPGKLLQGPHTNPETVVTLREALNRPAAISVEILNYHKQGREYWIQLNIQPLHDRAGTHVGFFSTAFDISARKQAEAALRESEARFRALSDVSPVGIFSTDAAGRTTFVNQRWCEIAGLTFAEALGDAWISAVHPDDRAALGQGWNEAVRAGTPTTVQYRFLKPDGTVTHLVGHSRPQRLADGTITGHVGTITDITSLRQAEESKKKTEAQLRQAQKMESLGTLAGGIAHDFNNILTGILGFAQLSLTDLEPDHPARQWSEGILRSGDRAKSLVRQILAFSRKTESSRKPLRLQAVAQESADLLRSTLPAMVRLERHLDPACPPVLADATEIHQVILNLCTNAWHALPDQTGVIELLLAPCEVSADFASDHPPLQPGPHVRLSVHDNGRGMNAATLERMFEPFFTTKEVGKGTGLGLSVVHSVVTSHGGAITVESEPGRGTRFDLYLPALAATPSAAVTVVPAATGPRGQGQKVLVVDDDFISGTVVAGLLERLGYNPTYCGDPFDAIAMLRSEDYALLVTDLAMPGLTGDQLARETLAHRPGLPVLLISGFIEPAKLEQIRALGIREVLGKPPGYAELAEAVRRCFAA